MPCRPVARSSADLNQILEQGQSLQEVTSDQEQAAYVQSLEDQIEVMCRLVPGVKEAKATVLLSPDPSLKSLGTVQKVTVEIQSGAQQAEDREIADQVQETVASLFGLQKEQVTVNFSSQESGVRIKKHLASMEVRSRSIRFVRLNVGCSRLYNSEIMMV